jgi:hypothetical protein
MAQSKEEILHEYFVTITRKGGQSKSPAKIKAAKANLEKALLKRWGKKIRLRKPKHE